MTSMDSYPFEQNANIGISNLYFSFELLLQNDNMVFL